MLVDVLCRAAPGAVEAAAEDDAAGVRTAAGPSVEGTLAAGVNVTVCGCEGWNASLIRIGPALRQRCDASTIR